jgi:hypothetical protein
LRGIPKIASAIAKPMERKPGMTRTMVVTELAAIAQSDISQYLELVDGRLIVKEPGDALEGSALGDPINARADKSKRRGDSIRSPVALQQLGRPTRLCYLF